MNFKYVIAKVEFNEYFEVSILRKTELLDPTTGTIYPLAPEQANWRTTLAPQENLDLTAALSIDGASLDPVCLTVIKQYWEPTLRTLWKPELIERYQHLKETVSTENLNP